MNCLCCGKPIPETASFEEKNTGWHRTCVRKFFGTSVLPEIRISDDSFYTLAVEAAGKGLTVPGVQKKLSLHLTRQGTPRLDLADYPTGYILKPQIDLFPYLPEWEYLSMQMAKATGIRTVPFALIKTGSDGALAYITKRIDRIIPARKDQKHQCFGMEDFCQLDGRLAENKYQGSYERCAEIVSRYSVYPGLDLSELFLRIVFFLVSGNSDMHLKNFSLIETRPGSRDYILSPAYDLLSTSLIVPGDTEQLALTVNGKKKDIQRDDLMKFANIISIPEKAAIRMIEKVISMKDRYISLCYNSLIPREFKERLVNLTASRIRELSAKTPENIDDHKYPDLFPF